MSDNVDLSLDDIIKKNKKTRGGKVLAGKRGSTRGRGKLAGRRGRTITNVGTRGRGRGRSNSRRTANPGSIRGRNVGRGRGGGRSGGARGRRNNFRANQQLQNQTILNAWKQVASSSRGRRGRGPLQGRRQNIKTRFMGGNTRFLSGIRTRQPNILLKTAPPRWMSDFRFRQPGILMLARKRVQKLRKVLASRRANPVQGRIAVSRFGLITTSRLNAQRESVKAQIQKKINRAQAARNASSRSSMRNIFQNSTGQLLQRSPTKSPTWDHFPTRRAPPRNEAWTGAVRTVRNSNENVVKNHLNPEIQRKIQILQQQGRRIRGEEMMDLDSQPEIRPPVLASTISLSDRFRMFMN